MNQQSTDNSGTSQVIGPNSQHLFNFVKGDVPVQRSSLDHALLCITRHSTLLHLAITDQLHHMLNDPTSVSDDVTFSLACVYLLFFKARKYQTRNDHLSSVCLISFYLKAELEKGQRKGNVAQKRFQYSPGSFSLTWGICFIRSATTLTPFRNTFRPNLIAVNMKTVTLPFKRLLYFSKSTHLN